MSDTTTEPMRQPWHVAAIKDPERRLAAAAKLRKQAKARVNEARARRDIAAIIAYYDHHIAPAAIYNKKTGPLKTSRGLFNRLIQRAPGDAERKEIMAANPALAEDPMAVIAEAAAEVAKYRAVEEKAREIRDETALKLMNGVNDDGEKVPAMTNAQVARITGLTTARVAQIRAGF